MEVLGVYVQFIFGVLACINVVPYHVDIQWPECELKMI